MEEERDRDNDEIVIDEGEEETPSTPHLVPVQYETVLHPLKSEADRFGEELEAFGVRLETTNPQKSRTPRERYSKVLKLAGEYCDLASDKVERLKREDAASHHRKLVDKQRRRIHRPREVESSNAAAVGDGIDLWEQELYTWRLLRDLLPLRYSGPGTDVSASKRKRLDDLGVVNRFSSDRTIWERYLISDDIAQERNVVLSWLKDSAMSSSAGINAIAEQLEEATDRGTGLWADGWLHTKEAIKGQKRLRSIQKPLEPEPDDSPSTLLNADRTQSLVTQLDPDAACRQGRSLEEQDKYYERAVWLGCWELLRRGASYADIREWCRDRAEGWRAISARGSLASWDSVVDGSFGDAELNGGDHGMSGAPANEASRSSMSGKSRSLWRRMCVQLAREGGDDEYERAVYGILGGDAAAIEKVCLSWDDFVFAHYHTLLVHGFDLYLQAHHPDRVSTPLARNFGSLNAVFLQGQPGDAAGQLIEALRIDERTKDEARQPMKMIQGALIANEFVDFAIRQGVALGRAANSEERSKLIVTSNLLALEDLTSTTVSCSDPNIMRVIAHILIILRDLGEDFGGGERQVAVENNIVAYVNFLRLSGKMLMVPNYASRLSESRRILTMGRVLLDTIDPRTRRDLILIMGVFKINVHKVIQMQMRYIFDETKFLNRPLPSTPLSILERSTSDVEQLGKIRENFIGEESDLDDDDDLLIRSYEWYLLIEGHWRETFKAGALLYKQFLRSGRLIAARDLYRRIPGSEISLAKTGALIGANYDLTKHMPESDDEEGGEEEEEIDLSSSRRTTRSSSQRQQSRRRRTGPRRSERNRATAEVLISEAQVFFGLEKLVAALIALDEWGVISAIVVADVKQKSAKRAELQRTFEAVISTVEPLLHGWLTDVPKDDASDISKIREAYLPEIVIAYNSACHVAGHILGRDHLLRCLNLSVDVAANDSDILPCLVASGRLPELVIAFAISSKAIVQAGENRGTKSKRKRGGDGETLSIWQVKP
ncbi:MAG: hypothetical protein M1825_004118 [Sarcosagium campestre]|nr:MAG: hypothetical protein M1825_004118 [Sarcosagium campestre]